MDAGHWTRDAGLLDTGHWTLDEGLLRLRQIFNVRRSVLTPTSLIASP
jgi:hypothetical protein